MMINIMILMIMVISMMIMIIMTMMMMITKLMMTRMIVIVTMKILLKVTRIMHMMITTVNEESNERVKSLSTHALDMVCSIIRMQSNQNLTRVIHQLNNHEHWCACAGRSVTTIPARDNYLGSKRVN